VTEADSDSLLIDENVLYTVRNIHHRYVMVKKKQSSNKTMGIYQNNKLKHTNEKRERRKSDDMTYKNINKENNNIIV